MSFLTFISGVLATVLGFGFTSLLKQFVFDIFQEEQKLKGDIKANLVFHANASNQTELQIAQTEFRKLASRSYSLTTHFIIRKNNRDRAYESLGENLIGYSNSIPNSGTKKKFQQKIETFINRK